MMTWRMKYLEILPRSADSLLCIVMSYPVKKWEILSMFLCEFLTSIMLAACDKLIINAPANVSKINK